MARINGQGRGVAVLIGDTRPEALSASIAAGSPSHRADLHPQDYGIGAQILKDLGAVEIALFPDHVGAVAGLHGYGLSVVGPAVPRRGTTPFRPRGRSRSREAGTQTESAAPVSLVRKS
ncbi:bifunctional 3,4-dihydroxy-2-butanone 4-phosphate synthase/GTP cyclohydrolase II/unknown domain fusion protein [Methyloligella halotolerans]|uniref:GTP cyclohydrolase II domain-containing protein n=2 Tax=Methyloligella halotolerans TaxID=1177755 RepID=A0A1E2S418_9HYPH|nr:bifunctional 3,4-dihydroxy-2-butanone 4-phosphate synthase/GTP cyclohydrolase II/unknown domain fusion protein [Methyloligella halotolerans]